MCCFKALLFDFGGTLDANGIHWGERLYPLYQAAGIRLSWDDFQRAHFHADDHLAQAHDLNSLDLEKTLTLQVQDVLRFLEIRPDSLVPQIVSAFLKDSRRHLKKNRPLLEKLHSKYRLGIVSNFYGNLPSVLKGEGLQGLFGVTADSSLVGASKPDRRIFEYALEALQVPSEQALMVGDSLDRDMKGAEGAGIPHAWLYGDRYLSGERPDSCCPQAYVLRSLEEIEHVCRDHRRRQRREA